MVICFIVSRGGRIAWMSDTGTFIDRIRKAVTVTRDIPAWKRGERTVAIRRRVWEWRVKFQKAAYYWLMLVLIVKMKFSWRICARSKCNFTLHAGPLCGRYPMVDQPSLILVESWNRLEWVIRNIWIISYTAFSNWTCRVCSKKEAASLFLHIFFCPIL